jgi:hypothetical protein
MICNIFFAVREIKKKIDSVLVIGRIENVLKLCKLIKKLFE